MKTRMIYELNNTYMVLMPDFLVKEEDYRYRMLAANEIKNILPLEIRTINSERNIFINVSGKESLLSKMNSRFWGRDEVRKLFESILMTTKDLSRYLIGEKDIVLRPELIFYNSSTDEYEFVCVPKDSSKKESECEMLELFQFILSRLQKEDEIFVNTMYTICDMYAGENKPGFELVFEYFSEETRQNVQEEVADEVIDETENVIPRYIPSLKEICAYTMCAAGFILIFFNIYLSMP